jgi:peptide/nickel transport system ATP-binding protein
MPTGGVIVRNGPVQLVMQDPGASLNPRFTAREAIEEPLRIRKRPCEGRAAQLLECVGIDPACALRRTNQFSGGERARIAIARALAAIAGRQGVILFDESFASLDDETQASLLDLLFVLHKDGLTFVVISHDREWLEGFATELLIMRGGRIVG